MAILKGKTFEEFCPLRGLPCKNEKCAFCIEDVYGDLKCAITVIAEEFTRGIGIQTHSGDTVVAEIEVY